MMRGSKRCLISAFYRQANVGAGLLAKAICLQMMMMWG
jgi:hypothetical protein